MTVTLYHGDWFSCIVCESEFWRKPSAIAKGDCKFCSKKCYFEWQRGKKKNTVAVFPRSGEKNPNWKGGITPLNQIIRNSQASKEWREKIFERDDWTCKECGARNGLGKRVILHAHHIKPFATYPDLRFDVNNGVTLCKSCHDKKPKGMAVYSV